MAVGLSLLLSGCLLTRLYAFKQQFCDFDRYFSLGLDDGVSIQLAEPVLLDSDMIWLAGAEPTLDQARPGGRSMSYVIEKVPAAGSAPEPSHGFTVDLEFRSFGEDLKLEEVRLDHRFARIAVPDVMDRRVRNACDAGWLSGLSGEIDLADADLSRLPTRDEVLAQLGPPREWFDEQRGLSYVYQLKNNASRSYTLTLWYDASGEQLLKSGSRSPRYTTTTDYRLKKMWVRAR